MFAAPALLPPFAVPALFPSWSVWVRERCGGVRGEGVGEGCVSYKQAATLQTLSIWMGGDLTTCRCSTLE